ncbi:hypothetical protein U1E44_08265 [Arenibacter sp. GZD96]|uniref:hypothetical protein n=1 Tax=Aurantibrevibacter litoralis TaxID=3106030 RepID=UPI002AFE01AD|nr:hypothetical protein [Arenibacter sp. GZD-96]MEA1786081.1 hypothetical protein [Arenibacter sp. GZD-96]
MVSRWLTYFLEGRVYAAIEMYDHQGITYYTTLVLKKEKGELTILRATEVTKLEELKDWIGTKASLFLTINTHNVLTKPIADMELNSHEAKVNHTFPNLNLEAFYYDIFLDESYPMVSIARMDVVEEVINALGEIGMQPSAVQLGLAGLGSVLPHLESGSVQGSNFGLDIELSRIREVYPQSSAEDTYRLNGLELQGRHLLGFAHILGHLEGRISVTNLTEINDSLSYTFKNKRIFTTVAKSALVFFLILLLVNFFVFDHYYTKVQETKTSSELHSSQVKQFKALSTLVTEKQERVDLLNRSGNSRATHYLDQLAINVPSTVFLGEMQFQSLKKPFREGKSLDIEEGVLKVSGISSESAAFSMWIALLEEQKWIQSVEILGYDFVTKENSEFAIKIVLEE